MLYHFYPWPVEVLKEWWPQEKTQTVVLTSWPWVSRPSSQIQGKHSQIVFRSADVWVQPFLSLLSLRHADLLLGVKAEGVTAWCCCVCVSVCTHACTCAHIRGSWLSGPCLLELPSKNEFWDTFEESLGLHDTENTELAKYPPFIFAESEFWRI